MRIGKLKALKLFKILYQSRRKRGRGFGVLPRITLRQTWTKV
jgi:hypothetical protein